jgi:hypothetical protein
MPKINGFFGTACLGFFEVFAVSIFIFLRRCLMPYYIRIVKMSSKESGSARLLADRDGNVEAFWSQQEAWGAIGRVSKDVGEKYHLDVICDTEFRQLWKSGAKGISAAEIDRDIVSG